MDIKNSKGFSLLEIIVGMLILGLVVTGVFGLFVSSHRFIIQARHRLSALNYARGVAETLKVYVTADLGTDLSSGTPSGASFVWNVTDPTSKPLSLPNINDIIPELGGGATCSYIVQNDPQDAIGLREVTITVTYPTES